VRTKATVMIVSTSLSALEELEPLLERKYTVIGAAEDVRHIAPYVQNVRPDVIVLDVRDREVQRTTAERLARCSPETKLLFFGKAYSADGYAVQTTAELPSAIPALLASGRAGHILNEPVSTEAECTEIYLG
jgi:AmiR/NasT family two-component response regulator